MAAQVQTKKFSFGGCTVSGFSPEVSAISPKTEMLNVSISFEDALKLNLAIQECVRKLNSYNRSTSVGKRTGLNIAVHLQNRRITVKETTV
ncbi:MAG: hypothetical protein AB7O31_15920 [Burkholderiales bacterium]